MKRIVSVIGVCAANLLLIGCATTGSAGKASAEAVAAALAQTDRDPGDMKYDTQRKTSETLAFAGVSAGSTVVDLVASTGYTTEVLSRTVGASGKVYACNPKPLLQAFKPVADGWNARLERYKNANLVRLDNEDLETLSNVPDASADLAIIVLNYHDMNLMGIDKAKLNKAVLRVLKPGGSYVVLDHNAAAGKKDTDGPKIHRIEESFAVDEIKAAGFTLDASSDLLRNASDARDWDPNPFVCGERCGTSDRFLVKFKKP